MTYDDDYKVNENMRFIKCPRCGNEEYSAGAQFCKICGFPAYNKCMGSQEYDNVGNNMGFKIHYNVGNARFCEYCGKPTTLFNEKFLKSYTELQSDQEDNDPFDEKLPFD